jgi:hypothetical protein
MLHRFEVGDAPAPNYAFATGFEICEFRTGLAKGSGKVQ